MNNARVSLTPGGHRLEFKVAATTSLLWWISLGAASTGPIPEAGERDDVTKLTLEELGAIRVTSVSKKEERLNRVPAAVTVITGDDIRRSGAQTIAEALRLAPGVQVAQVDAAQTAISARGFNDTFSQKLLVLMDGRSVYTPLFSGTFWQAQDVLLEDVDRIEVIRGPGSTVWGANAVNGVINIVNKTARETQGFLVSGGGGSSHSAAAGVRYGVQPSDATFLRIYGKYDNWDNFTAIDGGKANDAWWKGQGGFRSDWEPTTADRVTLQGDLFGLRVDQTSPQIQIPNPAVNPPDFRYNGQQFSRFDLNGGNILGRWTHQFSEDSDLSIQAYYDRQRLSLALVQEDRSTYDLDLKYRFQLGGRNEVVWGGGYRLSHSDLTESPEVSFARTSRADQVFNSFVQDEFKILPDKLHLTFGTKLEHNDYSGVEYEPGMRLAWTPSERQTVWASVARAVRTPSQFERDAKVRLAVLPAGEQSPVPTLITVDGSDDFMSETLIAYELGYRIQTSPHLTFDAATFLNRYDRLRNINTTVDLGTLPSYATAHNIFGNLSHGQTYGLELSATYQVTSWWRMHGLLGLIESDLSGPVDRLHFGNGTVQISTPEHQLSLRSSMNLGRNWELDAGARWIGGFLQNGASVPGFDGTVLHIPAYVTFDLRLGWRPTKNLEFALIGQNLSGNHREFSPTFVSTSITQVSRSVFAKLIWKF